MQYWDDFRDKYGFQDGDSVPEGVEIYRTVYVRYLNALLNHLGSGVRAIAYNRPGMHNYFLIRVVTAAAFDSLSLDQVESGKSQAAWVTDEEPALDDAYHEAVEQAMQDNLDSYVVVQVMIARDFGRLMSQFT